MIKFIVSLGFILCFTTQPLAQIYKQNNLRPRFRVLSESAAKDTLDIFMFAGQSNMVGRDTIPNLSTQYAYLLDTLNSNVRISNKGSDLDRLVMSRVATNFNGGQEGDVKPETSFSDTLFKATGRPFIVYKYAIGATQLTQTDTLTDWNANSVGEYFDDLLLGLDILRDKIYLEGKIPRLAAFFWMQGEQDASPPKDALYQGNLDTLFMFLKREIRPIDPSLPIIVGAMRGSDEGNTGGLFEVIRDAQKAVVRYEQDSGGIVTDTPYLHENTYLIHTLDYTTFDGIHWTADNIVDFGWQMYTAYKYLIGL